MPVPVTCTGSNVCTGFFRPKVAINTLMVVGLGYFALTLIRDHYALLVISPQSGNEIYEQVCFTTPNFVDLNFECPYLVY